jgi:hypothetical protein
MMLVLGANMIKIKPGNKGLLHKKMGVPEGTTLKASALEAKKKSAKKSGNVKLEREVVFAQNFRHKK